MKLYTTEGKQTESIINYRATKGNEIIKSLEEKYGMVDEAMERAVMASFTNSDYITIKGCKGIDKSKSEVSAVRVLGKSGNMLSIVAIDADKNQRKGLVQASKVYSAMGLQSNSIVEENKRNSEKETYGEDR